MLLKNLNERTEHASISKYFEIGNMKETALNHLYSDLYHVAVT